jgi:hypothetical protein
MTEPGTDAELGDHYDRHRDLTAWGEPAPQRTAGLKPTTDIRRLVLAADEAPLDRTRLARTVDALARELDDLRRMAR